MMRRWVWMGMLMLAAALLVAWHGLWFALGFMAGYAWTVAVIAAAAARAGYRTARRSHDGASHLD